MGLTSGKSSRPNATSTTSRALPVPLPISSAVYTTPPDVIGVVKPASEEVVFGPLAYLPPEATERASISEVPRAPMNNEADAEFPNELSRDFAHAMDVANVETFAGDFATAKDVYKKLENEFVSRAEEDEVIEIQRRVAEAILKAGVEKHAPFEACTECWNELLRLGFTNLDRTCTMSWYYAECCRQNRQPDVGAAVLKPLIAKLQRLLGDPDLDEDEAEYYRYEIANLSKLHARLEALP